MNRFTAIFGPSLFILAIAACVAVAVIGVSWYQTGSAIDFSSQFSSSWPLDWNWPGLPIAHHVIEAAVVALGLDMSFPMFSWMSSLYGATLATFLNITCVLVILFIVVSITHHVWELLKWLWLRFKNAHSL